MTKFRLPRKIKKAIPSGMYCYKFVRYDHENSRMIIKVCKFFDHIKLKDKPVDKQDEIDKEYPEEYTGWCKLIKHEIDDQCKSCGHKKP